MTTFPAIAMTATAMVIQHARRDRLGHERAGPRDDRWGERTALHRWRALAEAEAAARAAMALDVITRDVVLDHLIVVDIVTGRHAQAIDRVEQLMSMPSQLKPARLRLDPIYDPLRADPRFRALAGEGP